MWLLESLNNARQTAREAGVSEADAGNALLASLRGMRVPNQGVQSRGGRYSIPRGPMEHLMLRAPCEAAA